MKNFFLWVVTTIIKDVSGALILSVIAIGLLVIAAVNAPDYFNVLFFPVIIGVFFLYAKFIK
ncbi:hypothetical protein HVX31_03535 [Escherichia coli]|nr:hypothetical protein HVZ30_03640 [Escherichia coli]QML59283.1 hypothetical protein HVX31_03535 [Escherichia coli]